jgi:hypothetical protein
MGRNGSNRKFPGGRYGYRMNFRREEAQKRQDARDHRTPEQQLALLDSRLGAGQGARKERARLAALIEQSNSEKARKERKEVGKNSSTK